MDLELDRYEKEMRELAGLSPRSGGERQSSSAGDKSTTAQGSGIVSGSKLYQTVRTARLHALASMSLRDGASHPMRGVGYLEPSDDMRGRRVITSFRYSDKTNLTSTFGLEDLVCVGCERSHKIMFRSGTRVKPEDMGPLLVILSDQHFPACLTPTGRGECIKIIRIEDASLEQLVSKFLQAAKGHVVPAGTVIQICSLSHLKSVGLESYCGDLVKAIDSIWQKYRGGVTTVHGFPIANCLITDTTIINGAYNVYRWYVSVLPKRARYVHNTAKMAFSAFVKESESSGGHEDGERRRLPRGLLTTAGGSIFSTCGLQSTRAQVERTDIVRESHLLNSLIKEYNSTFSMGLAEKISLERKETALSTATGREGKDDAIVMVIGASHADRLASVLEKEGLTIVNLARPGWTLTDTNVEAKRKEIVFELQRSPSTALVLFMCFDNSAYFGSTTIGSRHSATRDSSGTYHVEGRLVTARKDDIREMGAAILPLVNEVANIQKVVVTPLPRYLEGGCCGDQRHVTNRGSENYVQRMMEAALDFRKWTREFFHKQKAGGLRVVAPADVLEMEKKMREGEGVSELWDYDNVHLSGEGYAKLGAALAVIIRGQLGDPGSAPRAARRHVAELDSYEGSNRWTRPRMDSK